jgi:hypothetical protein
MRTKLLPDISRYNPVVVSNFMRDYVYFFTSPNGGYICDENEKMSESKNKGFLNIKIGGKIKE